MEFKTIVPDGLLFYVADDRQVDFIAVYLEEGKLKHSFNCGSGAARLVSTGTYNDGQWHRVSMSSSILIQAQFVGIRKPSFSTT